MMKASQIVSECFKPATELLLSNIEEPDSAFSRSYASVFRQYALFAERQYHVLSKSPDALRLKFYMDRKREEMKQRRHELTRNPQDAGIHRMYLKRTEKILAEDEHRY